jgi:prolyl-tRNA synthetase
MRLSKMLLPTLRENPKDAEIESHILMIRAGLMRKVGTGLYTFLPLGMRSVLKVTDIIRSEMNLSDAQEILPPVLTPAGLWIESGRYEKMGKEMMRLKDRHENEMVLGPTHEEAFAAVVRENVTSYRSLPLNLYQINTKFRDEIRPRFGVMRCREFTMMDAYSFDIDEAGLDKSYNIMSEIYRRIFIRCGLNAVPVLADSGTMGGSTSEEFMVPSAVGESEIIKCSSCNYIANAERATSSIKFKKNTAPLKPMKEVTTPDVRTIDELTQFFKTTPDRFIKSIIYTADGRPFMAIIRGDLTINEVKLKNALGCAELELADEETVKKVSHAPVGFASPIGLDNLQIISDESVTFMVNAITGANKKDSHFINVNPGRDFDTGTVSDIRLVMSGEKCPECGKTLESYRGIEVGHVFKIGYKYTHSMNVRVLDRNGKEIFPIMGSYGIGIGRTLACIIEQNRDENGIIWPMTIAPFQIIILPVNTEDKEIMKISLKLYESLSGKYETLIDDRNERPGVKFKDADLIGIPIRVTIGKSFNENGTIELKQRHKAEKEYKPVYTALQRINEIFEEQMSRLIPAQRGLKGVGNG